MLVGSGATVVYAADDATGMDVVFANTQLAVIGSQTLAALVDARSDVGTNAPNADDVVTAECCAFTYAQFEAKTVDAFVPMDVSKPTAKGIVVVDVRTDGLVFVAVTMFTGAITGAVVDT